MADRTSPLAPLDPFPERVGTTYEMKVAPNTTGQEGPARFYEGIASDTDVPNDFVEGLHDGYDVGSRPNHNKNVFEKPADQVTRERAHVGSAAWVEGPDYLGKFAGGTSNEAERKFIADDVGDSRKMRRNAAVVTD